MEEKGKKKSGVEKAEKIIIGIILVSLILIILTILFFSYFGYKSTNERKISLNPESIEQCRKVFSSPENCIMRFAVNQRNIDICFELEERYHQECYVFYQRFVRDTESCYRLEREEYQINCLNERAEQLALLHNNPDYCLEAHELYVDECFKIIIECERISDPSIASDCRLRRAIGLGRKYGSASCLEADEKDYNACLKAIASEAKDACGYITDPVLEAECWESIN